MAWPLRARTFIVKSRTLGVEVGLLAGGRAARRSAERVVLLADDGKNGHSKLLGEGAASEELVTESTSVPAGHGVLAGLISRRHFLFGVPGIYPGFA
jgi:hypothetical protein